MADLQVIRRHKGNVRRKHLCHFFFQQCIETIGNVGNVTNRITTQTKGGIVVAAAGVLDEEQGRDDLQRHHVWRYRRQQFSERRRLLLTADDVCIEESLQVVVAVVVNLLWQEDVIHAAQRFQPMTACLVVDHADGVVVDEVETVNASTHLQLRQRSIGNRQLKRAVDVALQSENGKWCQTDINLDELSQVVYDDLTVDEVQSTRSLSMIITGSRGKLLVESLVHSPLYFHLCLQQVL